ncbi:MAG: MFS transporter [Flavobacteriaceae bacterium]
MSKLEQGLRKNWKQFTLLVIINGFVGGMVGLERSILPELAKTEFDLAVKTALLSFIVVFGITKALSNYFAGAFANKIGRKNLLVIGWVFALPVPIILMHAPSWNWIIGANVLLGINQGLSWSSTVVMKVDLVGPKNRGLAMGINESAGYVAVGLTALFTGLIAARYGLRPYPFYLGIGFSILGLVSSWLLVKDTAAHVVSEQITSSLKPMGNVFASTTWKHPNLGSITQAGLTNNLNDGMIWGILPLLLASKGFSIAEIGSIAAIYPLVWGLSQLLTGKLGDLFPKKPLLFYGMLIQGLSILGLVYADSHLSFVLLSVLLGLGTAVVYPTFLAAIADNTHPSERANSIGVFRLWRDLGYAFGAAITGIIADQFSLQAALGSVGLLTVLSALILAKRMTPMNEPLAKEAKTSGSNKRNE